MKALLIYANQSTAVMDVPDDSHALIIESINKDPFTGHDVPHVLSANKKFIEVGNYPIHGLFLFQEVEL